MKKIINNIALNAKSKKNSDCFIVDIGAGEGGLCKSIFEYIHSV